VNNRDAFILLNGLSKIGPISAKSLLENFNSDPCAIFQAGRSELLKIKGIGEKIFESLKGSKNEEWLAEEKQKIEKRNVTFLVQPELPELLLQIYDPPIGLYIAGKIPNRPFVAIVGTRNPTMYGQKQARLMAEKLTQAGFCVVSGMARGIDTAAHEGALDAGGPTVAFLGSGLDIVYPPENINLYKRIIETGAVVSEFPFGRRADRQTFPMRNRLVSGISQGVLVVESAASGGSLITAQFAADQGRTVFAVPGRVDQPSSAGCHKIIREGATLVCSANEIIDDLRPYMKKDQYLLNYTDQDNEPNSNSGILGEVSGDEGLIINKLMGGEQLSLDELSKRTSLSMPDTMSALTLLELSRRVKKYPSGKYELI
jgi:DNA processing protein